MISIDDNDKRFLLLERAISDLKRGMPLIVKNNSSRYIVWSAERINAQDFDMIRQKGSGELIISGRRAQHLLSENHAKDLCIDLQNISYNEMHFMIGCNDNIKTNAKSDVDISSARDIKQHELNILQLCKIAELLPTIIICKDAIGVDEIYTVIDIDVIINSINLKLDTLFEVVRSDLCLRGSNNATIICYREKFALVEHYALVIGDVLTRNKEEIPIRIHSSCYTGDILDSLMCDCGSQLSKAIKDMSVSGGIILYLQQEGRGIGMLNKLRCYNLQKAGADTVDANHILGFEDDERSFGVAGRILNLLDVNNVVLMSNNPRKHTGLQECGINVTSMVPHVTGVNKNNEQYIQTKIDRLGHRISRS